MKLFESIQIQTIQGCNLKCSFCPNSYLPQTMELMEEKVYYKIIDQLKDLHYKGRVSPYLMNESLLDEKLPKFIKYTRDNLPDSIIMISTNGTLLTEKLANELFEAGIDRFLVSCYSEEMYNKIKSFNNEKIKPILLFKGDLTKRFYNRGGNIDLKAKRKSSGLTCKRPFDQMYISCDGKAILCCSDYKREVIMGDINNESLKDIWNSAIYDTYRRYLKLGERHRLLLCKSCNY